MNSYISTDKVITNILENTKRYILMEKKKKKVIEGFNSLPINIDEIIFTVDLLLDTNLTWVKTIPKDHQDKELYTRYTQTYINANNNFFTQLKSLTFDGPLQSRYSFNPIFATVTILD